MQVFTIAAAAFAMSAVLVRISIPLLTRLRAVAEENDRTMHRGAVPKGAGVPLLLACAAALVIGGVSGQRIMLIGGCAAILSALSFYDDRTPLPAAIRFPAHIAAAALLAFSLPADQMVFQGWLPSFADRLAATVAIAWMINLTNFMDGINGLAGAETVAVTLGLVLVATAAGSILQTDIWLAAALGGAAAGFMIWNARPIPRVFLGDSGSIPIGFLLGALLTGLAARGLWAAAIILPAYFVADATYTLLHRLLAGEKIWQAHRDHFYQRAARGLGAGLGAHLPVVLLVTAANAILIALALLSVEQPVFAVCLAAVTITALLLVLQRLSR